MPECTTCGDRFDTERGLNVHRARKHGRKYHDEEWLHGRFVDEDKTAAEIAEMCDVTPSTIGKHLSDAGIEVREEAVTVECTWCGAELERQPSSFGETDRFFCPGGECQGAWLSANRVGEDNPNYKRISVECDYCNEIFQRQPNAADRNDRDFCSRKCYSLWRSEEVRGDSHPRFSGGPADYGEGWNDKKKKRARARDDKECQHCGVSQDEHIKKSGRKLDVHHIQPARMFDDDAEANSLENLVTLCQSCHMQVWEPMAPLRPDIPSHAAD